jgi:hypothetical protein
MTEMVYAVLLVLNRPASSKVRPTHILLMNVFILGGFEQTEGHKDRRQLPLATQ